MITTADFLGYIFLSYFIAYIFGYFINGIFSVIKEVR
jgi:hypothetical protein